MTRGRSAQPDDLDRLEQKLQVARHHEAVQRSRVLELEAERERLQQPLDDLRRLRAQLAGYRLQARAAGRLHQPEDAARLIDTAALVDEAEDGELHDATLDGLIDALLDSRPYLGVGTPLLRDPRPPGLPGRSIGPVGRPSFSDQLRSELRHAVAIKHSGE